MGDLEHEARFPGSSAEITPGWLTRALRTAGALASGHVVSVEASALGRNTGLMSELVRLSLTYDTNQQLQCSSLIAKFPPNNSESRRNGVDFGFFEGECGFYRELAEQSDVPAPRCYFTRYDPGTGRFLTLLQDLSSARIGIVDDGCTSEEAARAVEILARFHASWWKSDALKRYRWLRSRTGRLDQLEPLLASAWPLFVERFRATFDDEQLDLLSRVPDLLNTSRHRLSVGPHTLLHGDFKLDNLFFSASGEITVADWGLVMNGPPMFDFATFVGINLTTTERRQREVELVDAYVRALYEHDVTSYGSEEALSDYKVQLFGLLPQLICAGGLATFADGAAMEEYASGVRRVLRAVQDHETEHHLLQ